MNHTLLLVLAATVAAGCTATPPTKDTRSAADAAAAFEKLKAMKGQWDADFDLDGTTDAKVTYDLIASDSCVVERLFEGTPHSMVTVFHMDGPRLLCTHYCAAGNQPRMEATEILPSTVSFKMIDVTNLASPGASRMDGVRFEFIDADHVTTEWSSRENGVEGEHADFGMTRAKEKSMDSTPEGSDFVILMYEDDNAWASMPKTQQDELMGRYMAWVGDLRTRGIFKSGAPCGAKQVLLSGDAASGTVAAIDHAPTKDVLTGFFVIRAMSLDDAVSIAKTCPSLTHGERIIVRPATHE